MSFYTAVVAGNKLNRWDELYPIDGDKIKRKIQKAFFSKPTKEDEELLKQIQSGQN